MTANTSRLLKQRRAALKRRDRDICREMNKKCRAAIRKDFREHYQREISRGGRANLWRILTPVIGRKKSPSEPPNINPDELNSYYVTVGPTTAAGVPAASEPIHARLPRVTTGSFNPRLTGVFT